MRGSLKQRCVHACKADTLIAGQQVVQFAHDIGHDPFGRLLAQLVVQRS